MKKMDEKTKWIVYLHENPFNNKKYVGITSQDPERRWGGGSGYHNNLPFYKDIRKYGWKNFKHTILETGISTADIGKIEQYYIDLYDTLNPEKGYNRANGGLNPGRLGLSHSKETKKKIGQANSKSVLCLNTNILYPSVTQAAQELGLSFKEISACCNNKRGAKSTKGLYWVYSNTVLTEQKCKQSISKIEKNAYTKQKHSVKCLETNIVYSSQREAQRQLNITRGAISNCIRGKQQTAGGFHWKEVEKNE